MTPHSTSSFRPRYASTRRPSRFSRHLAGAAALFVLTVAFVAAQPPAGGPPAGQPAGQPAGPPAQLPIRGLGPGPMADEPGSDFSPKPPVRPLTPAEQAARFLLPPGYRLELVLAEPDVVSPGVIAFDGNGRMYVAELRSYMLDADATNQTAPISRISRHESTKGDGRFDKHTVFVDGLKTPRLILPLDGDSILTMETDSDDVFRHTDTNGDGVADRKTLFFRGAGRRGNLEHQPSGFIWAMDNWIYSTYNAFRIRWTPGGEILKEPTAPNGGQWGLTQDDHGKVWFVDAGGERGPINFQTPIQYGAFNVEDQFERDFRVTWPAPPGLADMQGGMLRVRQPIGVLNHFTATCGQDVFRGHRLPDDLRGDLLFAEPVGRLIRRAKVVVNGGLTQLRNAYPGSEFILSTDPLFRPVNLVTAPDGTIYVADMYHGIIQESQWTPRGSYLRRKIEQHGMDKVIDRGRIWRLVHESRTPDTTQPRMLDETPAQLVAHLSHENGWWRDTAQKLLVLRQDRSVVPALQELVRASPSLLGRFHALWTLEGLGALDAALVREQMADPSPAMRVQAIRASESLVKAGDPTLAADVRGRLKDGDATVVIQAMLTLKLQQAADLPAIVEAAQKANRSRGVREIGEQLLRPPANTFGGGRTFFTAAQREVLQRGAATYNELCYACHGADGTGAPLAGAPAGTKMAPPLAGAARVLAHRDYVIKTLLHGLHGPLDGTTFQNVMAPMGDNTDAWVAEVASYIRSAFGNSAPLVSDADVARARAATTRRTPWTLEELEATVPSVVAPSGAWTLTASHNAVAAPRALPPVDPTAAAVTAWTSGAPQAPGMWFRVDLPSAVDLVEVQFDSTTTFRPPQGGAAARPGQGGPALLGTFPRGFRVEISLDGTTWTTAAEGRGTGSHTVVAFSPVRAKSVRITQTEAPEEPAPWTVSRLRLFAPPSPGAGSEP